MSGQLTPIQSESGGTPIEAAEFPARSPDPSVFQALEIASASKLRMQFKRLRLDKHTKHTPGLEKAQQTKLAGVFGRCLFWGCK